MKTETITVSGLKFKHVVKKVKEYNGFFWGDEPLEIFKHKYYRKEKFIGDIREGRLGGYCRVFNNKGKCIGASTQIALAEIRLVAHWRHHAKKKKAAKGVKDN